jgi:SNF2 family DNA or RNA helicase
MQDAFSYFKRTRSLNLDIKNPNVIFLKLDFDENGGFLEVVDKKGKAIDVNYLSYSGALRNILKNIDTIKERNSFVIDWEKGSSDGIYLADNDHLLWQLQRCDNLVDKDLKPITFANGNATLQLQIIDDATNEKALQAIPTLIHQETEVENFQLVTENFVLSTNNQLIELLPLGSNFKALPFFNAIFNKAEIRQFLSLFISNINNVEVIFEDYEMKSSEEKVVAEPGLVFEKIDENEALYMRVKQIVPSLGVDFLDQYDIFQIAELNKLEKTILIKYLDQQPIEDSFNEIQKLLDKNAPKQKGSRKSTDNAIREDDLFIIPKETASNFIYNDLPVLLLSYKVFGTEKLRSYKIVTKQPTLSLNLSHGIDFLEGDAELDFGTEKISLFNALGQFSKQNYVKLSDGSHAIVNQEYIDKLRRLFQKKRGGKAQISFFDLPLVADLIDEKVAAKTFKKSRAIFEGFNTLKSKRIRLPKVNATLRPYQKDGFKWLKYLYDNNLGGCLADDMGLGKTLQAITLLASIYPAATKPTLIIMPKSLLYNWQKEVRKFAPELDEFIHYGSDRNFDEAIKHQIIFTTYAIARNDVEQLKEVDWLNIILDESQNIKNINAQTTKAIMLLNAEHRFALSGTPIENNLGELYSLFRFLNPAMFGTLQRFNENYGIPIQKNGDENVVHELRKKIYPFILRRLKKNVLTELPDKTEQILYVEMSAPQRKFYEERRTYYNEMVKSMVATKGLIKSQFFIFQALSELRQLASVPEAKTNGTIASPKIEILIDNLMDAIANGHKILVFANFLATIELVSERLEEAGIDFVTMTGATRNRQQLVDEFQNNTKCKVFLLTLKTGGTGLNLTAADMVFIFDPWWNVAAENQAIDRTHRMGQKNAVTAYKMITQGTIEEKILQLQEKKRALFDNIISSDTAAFKSLSEDDINFILG